MKRKATIRLSIARTLLFATVALGAPALAQTPRHGTTAAPLSAGGSWNQMNQDNPATEVEMTLI